MTPKNSRNRNLKDATTQSWCRQLWLLGCGVEAEVLSKALVIEWPGLEGKEHYLRREFWTPGEYLPMASIIFSWGPQSENLQ
jgi:hypothetical protein